jgi:hypothetical protein
VTYFSLVITFLFISAWLGLTRGERAPSRVLAASLAAAMVCAQLALLLTR